MKTTALFAICACLIVCVCATCARGENLATNGSFEVEGSNTAWAADWSGTQPAAMMRTNSAAYEGSWSMACKGGVEDWAHVLQVFPQNLAGKTVRVTCWMMSPSSDSAVARLPGSFANCSALLKLEQPGSTAAIQEIPAMKDVSAGGVRDIWICVTNEVASFPAGTVNFKVVLLGIMTSGIIYYDDVRLEVISHSSVSNQLTTIFPWYGGSISVAPPSSDGLYVSNAVVTLTATAAAGFSFGGWGSDGSGMQNPLIVTMNVAKAVSATFNQHPLAFVDSNVWETFNSPFWSEAPWYGTEPNSPTRQFYYTNVEGRACLACYVPNCGSNAQLHTDFGLFPQPLSNKTTCVYSTYAPDMGQTYSMRGVTKNENDADNAIAVISVSAAGWQTIAPAVINPDMALCIWWIIYGGFPGDLGMPAGQSPTFYIDEMRVTGGSGPDMLVDDFTVNPTWVASGTWQKRPREWRYDPNSDYSRLWWPDHVYSVNTFDPTFATTNLCMSLTFEQGTSNYARAWIPASAPCLADLSAAAAVEADVMVSQSNTPVALWFKSGGEALTTYIVQQPAGWQHLSWLMPTGVDVGWTNVQQVGVMVRTEAGDAMTGQLFLDNITFLSVPEPGLMAVLVCALALLRRTR